MARDAEGKILTKAALAKIAAREEAAARAAANREKWKLDDRPLVVPAHGCGGLRMGPPAANRASPRAAKKEFLRAIAESVPAAVDVLKRLLESKDDRINAVGVQMMLQQMMGKGADRAFDLEDEARGGDEIDPAFLSAAQRAEYMGLLERIEELNRIAAANEADARAGVIQGEPADG